jgi:hypothetical protein
LTLFRKGNGAGYSTGKNVIEAKEVIVNASKDKITTNNDMAHGERANFFH